MEEEEWGKRNGKKKERAFAFTFQGVHVFKDFFRFYCGIESSTKETLRIESRVMME
jgi:hypothetical protein